MTKFTINSESELTQNLESALNALDEVTSDEEPIFDDETRKMLDKLIEQKDRQFNKSELAEESGISRDALYRRWDDLVDLGIIQEIENN